MEIRDEIDNLPPLKYKELKARKKLEKDKYIQNIIDKDFLLDPQFYSISNDLLKRSLDILTNLNILKDPNKKDNNNFSIKYFSDKISDANFYNFIDKNLIDSINFKIPSRMWIRDEEEKIINLLDDQNKLSTKDKKDLENKIKNMEINASKKRYDEYLFGKMYDNSAHMQKKMNEYESKIDEKIDILDHTLVYSCNNCGHPFSFGHLENMNANVEKK